MSLASERREAELERANYEKAVQAMRAGGGTFSGGSQPGTFTMNGKTVVGQAAEGVYDMASLNKAAKTRPGGIDVTVNGTPMLYIHPDYRSNPGITWKNGDQANGFVDAAAMREAHPKSDDWVKSYGPAIVGGVAGLGALAGPALAGGAAEGLAAGSGSGIGGGAGGALGADAGSGLGLNLSMDGVLGGGLGTASGGSGLGLATPALGAAPGAALGTGAEFALGSGALSGAGAGSGLTAGGALGAAAGGGSLLSGLGSGLSSLLPSGNGSTLGIPNNILGGLATGIGGYLASDSMGDAYRDVSNQFMNIGAPYRDKLNASYQPGFDLWQQPGYAGAFDQAADSAARAVSAKSGNPFGNPGAMAEIQSQLMNSSYLPALSNYRGQLGQFGGLGLNTAGAGSMAGANAEGGGWEAIGAGANQIFNPQPNIGDLFKQFGLGGNNQYAMNIGGMRQS